MLLQGMAQHEAFGIEGRKQHKRSILSLHALNIRRPKRDQSRLCGAIPEEGTMQL